MKFNELIKKIKADTEIVNVDNTEVLSYIGITTITVNETTYTDVSRVCLMNKNDAVMLYITQYQNKKVTGINIEEIESIIC